jgi:hypothetical protein
MHNLQVRNSCFYVMMATASICCYRSRNALRLSRSAQQRCGKHTSGEAQDLVVCMAEFLTPRELNRMGRFRAKNDTAAPANELQFF